MNTEGSEINKLKELNDLALVAGKKRQSDQTGFLHHFNQSQDGDVHQTIPVVENFLYVLALLQSKTAENMTEAKELLQKLLHFQNVQTGNFPIFLHEYPQCKDRFLGVQILPVIYYILKDFHTILGEEIKTRLKQATSKLIAICYESHAFKAAPFPLALKLASSSFMIAKQVNDSELEKKATDLLEELSKVNFHQSWCVPSCLAEIFISLQIMYNNVFDCPWKEFINHFKATWHNPSKTYVGPALKIYNQGNEPECSLYDLILGTISGSYSERSLKDASYHLQAVLIKTEEKLAGIEYPFRVDGLLNEAKWTIFQDDQFAYSTLEKGAVTNQTYENAYHPFYMVWGDHLYAHSFVMQGGNFSSIHLNAADNKIEIVGDLQPQFNVEDKEKSREIAFYYDVEPQTKMLVQNTATSTFDLTEHCEIIGPQISLHLTTRLAEGEGQFIGHFMRGNRPSQIQLKGSNRFNAYDWQIFLRTLRRSTNCKLMATIEIKKN